MKIAFQVAGGPVWPAGTTLVHAVLHALRVAGGPAVGTALLVRTGRPDVPDELRAEAGGIIHIPPLRRWTARWAYDNALRRLGVPEPAASRDLRALGVGAVFASWPFTRYRGIPLLLWIHDFQHVRLPDLFPAEERAERDRVFRAAAAAAARVVVTSEDVRRDFAAFAPAHAAKARVVRTAVFVPDAVYDQDPRDAAARHGLPEKFVYLPNNFLAHKNHARVFEAMGRLRRRGVDVVLACSGHADDYRDPALAGRLREQIDHEGIRDRVALLGLVPRLDVLLLMRQAACVLNPSRFEGLGLSAEEARSVGKRLLLSDIPPHREQDPPAATWFDPDRVDDLEAKLELVWRESSPGPDADLEREARARQPERIRAAAAAFLDAARDLPRALPGGES
jgi:glycosyltransferase involved in cell wall biosynthesis